MGQSEDDGRPPGADLHKLRETPIQDVYVRRNVSKKPIATAIIITITIIITCPLGS